MLALGAEAHQYNGIRSTGPRGSVPSYLYQVNEGRIGPDGQAINAYLNQREDVGTYCFMATPYIWSAIQFDANGNLLPLTQGDTLQMFPTYWVYRNGALGAQITQAMCRRSY